MDVTKGSQMGGEGMKHAYMANSNQNALILATLTVEAHTHHVTAHTTTVRFRK